MVITTAISRKCQKILSHQRQDFLPMAYYDLYWSFWSTPPMNFLYPGRAGGPRHLFHDSIFFPFSGHCLISGYWIDVGDQVNVLIIFPERHCHAPNDNWRVTSRITKRLEELCSSLFDVYMLKNTSTRWSLINLGSVDSLPNLFLRYTHAILPIIWSFLYYVGVELANKQFIPSAQLIARDICCDNCLLRG